MSWTGSWVVERLSVRLVDSSPDDGPGLADLAGLAVRRNPRRAHLVVSRVLGKHLPVDPRVAWAAGRLLGLRVAASLGDAAPYPTARAGEASLTMALRGDVTSALPALRAVAASVAQLPEPPLVVGYAETATALGHLVADAFDGARYLHSTRRRVPTVTPAGTFDEAHSHASEHLLLPADPTWLETAAPVVLVDDELTTGRTAAATIRALQSIRPRRRYVVAALLDLRTEADRAALAATAAELGVRVDVVALAHGHVACPDDVLERGLRLVAARERLDRSAQGLPAPRRAAPPRPGLRRPAQVRSAPVRRLDVWWPPDLPEGGRHGFTAEHRVALDHAVGRLAEGVGLPSGGRVLVLGTEELMYAPLAVARCLAERHSGMVHFASTTRSPVLPVDEPGYAIRTRLTFPAHDTADPGERFVYNVTPAPTGIGYDHIVLMVDRAGDTAELWRDDGLVSVLAGACGGLTVAVVPDLVPALVGEPAGTGGMR